jgi:hypothetical protein
MGSTMIQAALLTPSVHFEAHFTDPEMIDLDSSH